MFVCGRLECFQISCYSRAVSGLIVFFYFVVSLRVEVILYVEAVPCSLQSPGKYDLGNDMKSHFCNSLCLGLVDRCAW